MEIWKIIIIVLALLLMVVGLYVLLNNDTEPDDPVPPVDPPLVSICEIIAEYDNLLGSYVLTGGLAAEGQRNGTYRLIEPSNPNICIIVFEYDGYIDTTDNHQMITGRVYGKTMMWEREFVLLDDVVLR